MDPTVLAASAQILPSPAEADFVLSAGPPADDRHGRQRRNCYAFLQEASKRIQARQLGQGDFAR